MDCQKMLSVHRIGFQDKPIFLQLDLLISEDGELCISSESMQLLPERYDDWLTILDENIRDFYLSYLGQPPNSCFRELDSGREFLFIKHRVEPFKFNRLGRGVFNSINEFMLLASIIDRTIFKIQDIFYLGVPDTQIDTTVYNQIPLRVSNMLCIKPRDSKNLTHIQMLWRSIYCLF